MKKVVTYIEEVIQELGKVSWPTKDELKDSTVVVCIFSIIMAAFVWGADLFVNSILNGILG